MRRGQLPLGAAPFLLTPLLAWRLFPRRIIAQSAQSGLDKNAYSCGSRCGCVLQLPGCTCRPWSLRHEARRAEKVSNDLVDLEYVVLGLFARDPADEGNAVQEPLLRPSRRRRSTVAADHGCRPTTDHRRWCVSLEPEQAWGECRIAVTDSATLARNLPDREPDRGSGSGYN